MVKKFKNKTKGFTLVELLATIVILIIIILIVMPIILNVIEGARKNAFLRTGDMILRAGEIFSLSPGEEGYRGYELVDPREIPFSGGDLVTGELMYDDKGNMTMAIWNGRYCIVKDFEGEIIIIRDDSGAYCNLETLFAGEDPSGPGIPGATGYLCSNPGDVVPTEEYYFTFDQVTRTITGYSSEGPKDLIIPCTIAGANVEYIGANAFASMGLTSLIMPDVILAIGNYAFNNNLISNLELSNNVEIIGENAFAYNNLEHIIFPDSLRRIENSERYRVCGQISCWWLDRPSFIGNPLQSVIFGSGIEYIGKAVFKDITTLTEVDLRRSSNLTTIVAEAFRNTNITEIMISSSAITINAHAFYNINAINISINSDSATIGESAFQSNRAPVILSLGGNINGVGTNAFENSKIIDLTLVGTINLIGTGAFQNNLIENINWETVIVYGIAADAFKNNQLPDAQAFIYDRDSNGDETTVLASYAGANRSNIIIPDNITSLEKASFNGLGLIGTLNTGNGVTLIESSKFASNLLTTVIFGNGVTSIGASAFMSNQIGTLTLGNSLITIGTNAFRSNIISSIDWGSNVEIIGENAFAYNNLQSIVFPDSVRRIENSERYRVCGWISCWWLDRPSFIGNPLQSVTFGSGLEYIGQSVFRELTTLTAADLSRSNSLTTIATHAFRDTNITEIMISSSAITIGAHSFYSVNATNISINSNSATIGESAFQNNRAPVTVTLGQNINSIGANVFENSKIIDLTLGGTINSIGAGAFQNNLIENINWGNVTVYGIAADAFKNNQLSDAQAFIYDRDINGDETTVLASYAGANRSNIVIPDHTTSLEKASFNGLGLIGTLNTGNGVTLIENSKFASNLLETVIFGNGVTSIGASAFMSNQIGALTLGNSLITIGTNAFRSNIISNINWGSSIEIIGENAFAYNNLQNIVFPDSVRRIENSERYQVCGQISCWWLDRPSFIGNPLQSVTFGSGLEYIGQSVFRELTTLTAADLSRSNSLTTIATHAFRDSNITEIIISSGAITIGAHSFYSVNATNISINSNNATIGESAFQNNRAPVTVTLGENINSIGANVFQNSKIINLTLGGTINSIGSGSFQNNLIENINWGNVTVYGIAADAFKNNQLPDAQAFIYDRDINGAETTVLASYAGANRSNIVIPDNITSLEKASFNGLGLIGTLNTGNGVTLIESSKFASNLLTTVIFGNGVTSIGTSAFMSNQIATLTLGNNLITIGTNAFRSNVISNINWGSNVEIIGENSFAYNNLQTIVFPDSVRRIENSERYQVCGQISCWWVDRPSFIGNPLQSVTFGSGLEYIGQSVFSGLTTLTEADLSRSNSLTTIAAHAFNNTLLAEINIPSSVTTILDSAFASNLGLNLIFIRGKVDASHFGSLGLDWNGSCNNIIYELASCYVYSGNTITGYEDICVGNIEIADSLGGNIITTIADNAFANKELTRAVIPSTVTTIGTNAFAGNNIDPIVVMGKSNSGGFSSVGSNWHGGEYIIYENDINTCFKVASTTVNGYYNESVCPKNITIPNGVTTIAASAFINNGLTSVNFNNVEVVGNDAFQNNSLASITIPNNMTAIGSNPFTGNLLSSLTVSNGTKFTSLGVNWHGNILKVVFEGDSYEKNCFGVTGNLVTNYPLYCPENVVIPATVEGVTINGIGNNAFKSKAVRFVTLGSHIVTIGDNAFESNNIAWVDMNEGIETIGYRAFYNTGLEEVILPATLRTIGADAFANNSNLGLIEVLGKSDASGFESLGANWNGTCTNIMYMGN